MLLMFNVSPGVYTKTSKGKKSQALVRLVQEKKNLSALLQEKINFREAFSENKKSQDAILREKKLFSNFSPTPSPHH